MRKFMACAGLRLPAKYQAQFGEASQWGFGVLACPGFLDFGFADLVRSATGRTEIATVIPMFLGHSFDKSSEDFPWLSDIDNEAEETQIGTECSSFCDTLCTDTVSAEGIGSQWDPLTAVCTTLPPVLPGLESEPVPSAEVITRSSFIQSICRGRRCIWVSEAKCQRVPVVYRVDLIGAQILVENGEEAVCPAGRWQIEDITDIYEVDDGKTRFSRRLVASLLPEDWDSVLWIIFKNSTSGPQPAERTLCIVEESAEARANIMELLATLKRYSRRFQI